MNRVRENEAASMPRSTFYWVLFALLVAFLIGTWLMFRGRATPAERPPAPTQQAPPIGQGAP